MSEGKEIENSFIQKIWNNPVLRFCVGLVILLSLVYLILVGLAVVGAGFRLIFTQPAIGMLEGVQENHILAFYLGDLSTALLQSSSVSHTVTLHITVTEVCCRSPPRTLSAQWLHKLSVSRPPSLSSWGPTWGPPSPTLPSA